MKNPCTICAKHPICEECFYCRYFENDYWNCTEDDTPCFEYDPIEEESEEQRND